MNGAVLIISCDGLFFLFEFSAGAFLPHVAHLHYPSPFWEDSGLKKDYSPNGALKLTPLTLHLQSMRQRVRQSSENETCFSPLNFFKDHTRGTLFRQFIARSASLIHMERPRLGRTPPCAIKGVDECTLLVYI